MSPERKKEIFVLGLAVLYTLFTWLVFSVDIPALSNFSTLAIVVAVVAAVVWAGVLQFALLTTLANGGFGWAVIFLCSLAVAAVGRFSWPADIAAVALLFLAAAARASISGEMENRIHFRVRDIFRSSSRYLLLASALVLIGFAIPNLSALFGTQTISLPEKWVESWVKSGDAFITTIIPHYSSTMTVDGFLLGQIVAQGIDAQLVPQGQVDIARRQFSKQVGVTLQGDELMSTVAAKTVNHTLDSWARYNRPMFLATLVIIFLLAWRIVVSILIIPTLGFLSFLFFIFTRLGLLYKIQNVVNVERLRL